jgi:hypothetical protein
MAGCSCDSDEFSVRVSDELLFDPPDADRQRVRLRCRECGGKAGFLPIDALEPFGFGEEAVRESADPGPRQIHLNVTAEWETPGADGHREEAPPPNAPTEVGHDDGAE